MTATVALCCAAAALVIAPGTLPAGGLRARRHVDSVPASPPVPGPGAGRRRVVVAAVLAAAACVAAAGPVQGVLAAAVVAPVAGVAVALAGRRRVAVPADRSVALTVDLAAAVLRSGRPLTVALESAAPAASPASGALLLRVAGLCRLGAPPADAWALVPAGHPLAPLARDAVRSADSGVRLADTFERYARELRAEVSAAAAARAHRAGVAALGPLAACFLPSFVCLGIVPVVIGLGRSAFGVLG